jgi:hypothetical protein
MGLRYEIDARGTSARIVGTGILTMPEMIASVDQLTADGRFQPHFPVVVDFRDIDYNADLNDGDEFVAALKRLEPLLQNKMALVVPEHLQLLATLFCLLAKMGGMDRMKCFTSLKEALDWCGLA